jgi:hypothetical protein
MTKIESGTGKGTEAKVGSDFRLWTNAVTRPDGEQALIDGNAYNINTNPVSLSGTTGMLYIKNNEDKNLTIKAIAVGMGASATYNTTGAVTVTVIKNPTTGTLISGATTVPITQNRNFGSSKTLVADQFVGANTETITDGSDVLVLYMANAQSRLFATIDLTLQKGNSIGIEVNPNLASGAALCYVAAICHLETDT